MSGGMLNAIKAVRELLWHNGFRPMPVYNPDHADRERAGKAPLGKDWEKRARQTPPECIAIGSVVAWATNTGILCDGLRAIDLDIDEQPLVALVSQLAVNMLGATIIRTRANSPRCLLVYRATTGEPVKLTLVGASHTKDNSCKIEVLGRGQQFVAYGGHPSGAELQWLEGGPTDRALADLPAVSEDQVHAFLNACVPVIEAKPIGAKPAPKPNGQDHDGPATADIQDVAAAMALIPNTNAPDWESWNSVGLAIYAATEGSFAGWKIWSDWSAKNPADDPDYTLERWQHYEKSPPSQTGAGKLFAMVAAVSPGWRQPSKLGKRYTNGEARTPEAPVIPNPVPPPPPPVDNEAPGGGGGGPPPDPPPPRDDTGPRPEPPPADEDHDWPEPVDFEVLLAGGGEATADHMPPSLWPYIQDTAERMGVALSSVALAVMVTCSSAISEEWQIQPKQHDPLWTEQARLWGAIVGPPSIKKSPIISEVTKPIVALDAKAHGTWGEAMKDYKGKLKEWKKGDQNDEEPVAPRKDRYLVENATIEALSEVLRDDAGGKMTSPLGKVLVRQDELSEFLANLDKYTPNGKGSADRGSYLRLYNGGRFSIDRIIRGSFVIPNWSGCLLGGIQPEPIQRIAAEADNDGMLQRFMFDVPPPQSDGVDRAPDWPAIYAYRDLFPFLAALRPGKIKYGEEPERIAVTGFHVNAYAAQDDVRALIKYVSAVDSSQRLESAAGKWTGLFARLCLTFHLVEIAAARSRNEIGPHPESVSADIAERVRRYMREVLMPHLMRADALMFNTEETDHAAWVAGYILARGLDRITARDIVQDRKGLRAPEKRQTLYSIMAALNVLGWVEAVEPRNPSKPPNAWMVNPKVHLVFAKRAETERARRAAVRASIDETIKEARAGKSDAEPEC
jgi:hypothetical protein